jgi:serine/threonine protein kinase
MSSQMRSESYVLLSWNEMTRLLIKISGIFIDLVANMINLVASMYWCSSVTSRCLFTSFLFSIFLYQDLIRGMLTKDVEKRLTVTQALAHPWVSKAMTASSRSH